VISFAGEHEEGSVVFFSLSLSLSLFFSSPPPAPSLLLPSVSVSFLSLPLPTPPRPIPPGRRREEVVPVFGVSPERRAREERKGGERLSRRNEEEGGYAALAYALARKLAS